MRCRRTVCSSLSLETLVDTSAGWCGWAAMAAWSRWPRRRANYNGNAAISPDGRRAAVDIEAGTVGVWLYDFMRATLTPLTTGKGSSQAPRWTPDGTRIVYRGTRAGFRNLWWKRSGRRGKRRAFDDRRVHADARVVVG